MVEVARLELAASWSLTKRATKLRYTSINAKILYYTLLIMSRDLRAGVKSIFAIRVFRLLFFYDII